MLSGPSWLNDGSEIADPFGYGERAIQFLGMLRHPKSRRPDKALVFDDWQQRIIRKIYGPAHEDGRRICRTVFLQVGRGNRKTSLGAALMLLGTFGPERVQAGQVISAAADRKQARIAYEEAAGIIAATPQLQAAARVQDFKNRIVHPKSGAVYEAISADAATQFGRTPHLALVDELWAHRKIDLWHAIKTGLVKVPDSLLIVATTAGRGSNGPDYPIYEYAKKVATGEIEDDSFLPIIFEADKECVWTDESIWHAVNPGLRFGYPDLPGLRALAREAKERPADREAFQQFHLGIRQEHSTAPFVEMAVYDEGATPIDLTALEGRRCWIGVDCSSTMDLTAVVAAWRDDNGGYIVYPWFFVPEHNLQTKADKDGVPYPRWAAEGLIEATPGNAVDYRAVESRIRDLCTRFDVQEIVFDKAYAAAVMLPLQDDGFPVVTIQLGWITQSPALNELERAIVSRQFQHGGHAVLRWCFENVALHVDGAGNRCMGKNKSRNRIDGAFACWMSISRAAAGDTPTSIYETDERAGGLLFV